MPTTLDDLPMELFDSIASYLPCEDASSMRQICRQINDLTTPAFAKKFLENRIQFLTSPSVDSRIAR